MVSLERVKRKQVDFFDEQELPIFYEDTSDEQKLLEQIRNYEIFNVAEPAAGDWEDLKKAKSALDSALFQIHSLIEMVDMCKVSDATSGYSSDILSITSRKFLTVKHLINHKVAQVNWAQRLALKHKAILGSYKLIAEKSESIKENNRKQRLYMQKLMQISKRWKVTQVNNMLFAVIGKSSQGEDYKALLLRDPECGLKIEISPELKKMKVMQVRVYCDQINLPEVKLQKSIEFVELEKVEQGLIDLELMKELQEKICETNEYSVRTFTKKCIEVEVNTEEEVDVVVKVEMVEDFNENGLFKSILLGIYQEKEGDVFVKFSKLVAHVYIKMNVYSIIINCLQSLGHEYRIKENEVSNEKTIYTVILKRRKSKIVDLEVWRKEVFCTSYTQVCIASFIPLKIKTKIMLREIKTLIEKTIEIQEASIKHLNHLLA